MKRFDLNCGRLSLLRQKYIMVVSAIMLIVYLAPHQRQIQKPFPDNFLFMPGKHLIWILHGHRYTLADILWENWLQSADHIKPHDMLGPLAVTIVDLSPRFYKVYANAAIFLSLFGSEKESARTLFNRGMNVYPLDWQIPYRAAYHAMFEMNNDQAGAEYMVKAAMLGAPMWTAASAADIFVKQNKRDIAIQVLNDALKSSPNRYGKDRVQKKLESILKEAPSP